MSATSAPRPRIALLVLGLLLAVLLVAGIAVQAPGPGATEIEVFEYLASVAAGIAAIAIAFSVRPAWPLSIGLALGAFSGHWDTMGSPIALDRLFIGSAIVSALVREGRRSPEALRTRPIDWLLALVAIYAVGSSLLADTFQFEQTRFALLDRLSLLGFVLFFLAPKVYREARDRQVLLRVFVVLGAYLGVTALLETVELDALVFPGYITDPTVGTHHDRARGPFAEAAANGLVLYACVIMATIGALKWAGRWRWFAAIVAPLCALGILFTVTRAAWIAAAVATVVALLIVRETRRFVIPTVAVAAAGVLVAFAVIPGLQDQAEDRADADRPVWDRKNSTAAAFRMLQDKPVFGFGWGRFPWESGDYYRQPLDFPLTRQRNLHNVYLVNAVELGLVGGLLWLVVTIVAVVGSIVRRGPPHLRLWKLGLIAWAICYAISALSTPLGFALPTALLWTWAGVARGDSAS